MLVDCADCFYLDIWELQGKKMEQLSQHQQTLQYASLGVEEIENKGCLIYWTRTYTHTY